MVCSTRIKPVLRAALVLTVIGYLVDHADSAGRTFELVARDHQAVIVSGETKGGRLAWEWTGAHDDMRTVAAASPGVLLQTYIEKSAGRKLPLVLESKYDPAAAPLAIFVGATKKAQALFGDRLKGLDSDGYIIHVTPSFVVLAGNVRYAEVDFLRTYMGIDSYVPTALFTIIPKHETVEVPVETRVEVPVFFSRAFSALNTDNGLRAEPEIPWRMHAGHGRYAFHHNIHNFITVKEFGKTHPEYFPMYPKWHPSGGKRVIVSHGGKRGPCISNPEVVDIVIKKCREYFDEHPAKACISVGETDGWYCCCPKCTALTNRKTSFFGMAPHIGQYSNYWYAFMNQVAKAIQESHPGKSVGCLAYFGNTVPPTFPVERNIVPYVTESAATWVNEKNKEMRKKQIAAWAERVDNIGIYEYGYGMGFSIPRIYLHLMAERLQCVSDKCKKPGFYAEMYCNHGLDGPKAWITEKLLWDPKQDVDELLDQWSKACFGPAAKPMGDYFKRCEAAWMTNGPNVMAGKESGWSIYHFVPMLWGFRSEVQFDVYRPDDVDALTKLLDQAEVLAKGNQEVLERIDYFAEAFKMTEIAVKRHHAQSETIGLVDAEAEPEKVLSALLRNAKKEPPFELWRYMDKLRAGNPTVFMNGPTNTRVTRAMEYVFDNSVWKKVYAHLEAGERDRDKLVAQARDVLTKLAPGDLKADASAAARMKRVLSLADRVALTEWTDEPPTIDGNPDEKCWQWIDQNPWFVVDSAEAFPFATQFAWAYDEKHLYLALRCRDEYPASFENAPAKEDWWHVNFPRVEVFLSPDPRNVENGKVSSYRITVTPSGDIRDSSRQPVIAQYKIADNDKDQWQAEIALSWQHLSLDPERFPYLRLNLARHMRDRTATTGRWYTAGSWYPSYVFRHRPRKIAPEVSDRGWLIFGRKGT